MAFVQTTIARRSPIKARVLEVCSDLHMFLEHVYLRLLEASLSVTVSTPPCTPLRKSALTVVQDQGVIFLLEYCF